MTTRPTRLVHEFPASTMQTCCHGGLGSPWKSFNLHRTAIREKFFPVQSAKTGIRNSGGVQQDHLSHQTLHCETDDGGRHRNSADEDVASCCVFHSILTCAIMQIAQRTLPLRPKLSPLPTMEYQFGAGNNHLDPATTLTIILALKRATRMLLR